MLAIAFCVLLGMARAETDLAKAFVSPPDEAKPWVNMFWIGRITPVDITQHMEELKAKGAGGANLIDLKAMTDAPYMSDNWRQAFKHAVREADRLGLMLGVNTCPGWPSGGPWITPENGAWMMVNSETVIQGPQKFAGKLSEPTGKGTLYADVAVQAFRVSDRAATPPQVVTASSNPDHLPNLSDGNFNTTWKPATTDAQPWILVDFGKPHGVNWLWLDMGGKVAIEASDDGTAFKPIASLVGTGGNTIYQAVPATTARWFRVVVPKDATVHDFALGSKAEVERVACMASKRGITHPLGVTDTRQIDQVNFVRQDLAALPEDRPLALHDRIDLTGKVAADGTLTWDVPAGNWKVVRIGRTTTGQKLAFGDGLVTDYLNPAAMEQHYEKGIVPLLGDVSGLVGKTWQYSIEDNFEADLMYSWTPKMLEEFKTRRGYDPLPYLATLAGEIVDSVEITDRFLADVRRTIADCAADQHYGRWAQLAHADGLKVRAEAGGQHHPRLYFNDGLMNQGRMDVPVAEFWEIELWKENQGAPADHNTITTPAWMDDAHNVNAKQAASAGHLYDKPLVASEAFTSGGRRSRWGTAPADLLLHANNAFCEGINALCIHGSATSGPETGLPGKSVFGGIHFSHNQTWWNQGAEGVLRYLSRCCYILRQGLFVADVLYYSGDEVPNFVPPKNIDPSRGFGYDYDMCNSEVLLTRLAVKHGRIVLPNGLSYRVLVLPERPVMPLAVIAKIEELVAAGATVIGPKPQRTPGLTDYPQSDQKLKAIAAKMWGTDATAPVLQKTYGKGHVIRGVSVREVLAKMAVPVDFAYTSKAESALMDFIHRRSGDTEIYFVMNRHATALQAECTFRVSGKLPESWDPVTGAQRALPQFAVMDGRTSVPLEFEPYGGLFVVFRKEIQRSEVGDQRSEVGDQRSDGATHNFLTFQPIQELTGSWTVQFDPKWFYPIDNLTGDAAKGLLVFDKLADWRTRPEHQVRNFSGTAVYRKIFDLAPEVRSQKSEVSKSHSDLRSPTSDLRSRLWLDLGAVKETAKVKLNGKDLGVLWCSPWRVDISGELKPGENILEISVVNLWSNRLSGDNGLPGDQRRTRTEAFMGGGDAQVSSGLLGPVTIQAAQPTATKDPSK